MADQRIVGNGMPSGNGRNGDFRFDDFEVDLAARELRKGGVKVHLEIQPYQVLLKLLERPGEVVSREELKQNLWADDTFVDFDNGVNQAISKIRRALGDSAVRPRFVETLPRRGYRFVGRIDAPEPAQPAPEPPKRWRVWIRYAALGLAGMFAGVLLYHFAGAGSESAPPEVPHRRWTYQIGDLQTTADRDALVAISPDGNHIGYVAGSDHRLWIQDLNQPSPRRLEGTEGVGRFAWSPDSETLVFAVQGAIKSIAVQGGVAATLWEDASINPSMTILWDADGAAVRFLHWGTQYELPRRGGQPHESSLDSEAFLWGPRFAALAPRLFFVQGFYHFEREIVRRDDEATESQSLAKGWNPWYSYDRILFQSMSPPRGLWAMPFSAETGGIDEPFPIAGAAGDSASVSDGGTLVFVARPIDGDQMLLLNRSGEVMRQIGSPQQFIGRPEFSPDGTRVTVWGFEYEQGADIWVHEVDRPLKTRLTTTEGLESQPVFSPEGNQVAFTSDRPGYGGDGPRIRNLFVKSTGDTKPPTLLAIDTWAWDWSPNGVYVLTTLRRGNNRGFDIGYLEINGEAPYTAKPLRTTKYREAHAQFSPDGRYVAFQSDDTGQDEIYVCSFPDCLDEKKVSLDGGMFPRWAKKQGSLYYRRGEDTLMEAPIKTQPELDVGMPRRLFSNLHLYQQGAVGTRLYDVSDDGERFVVVESAPSRISPENPATINVWQNWAASLKDEPMD